MPAIRWKNSAVVFFTAGWDALGQPGGIIFHDPDLLEQHTGCLGEVAGLLIELPA